jgi:nitrite reductase/ring-hydroxylating ferredoxin subunit
MNAAPADMLIPADRVPMPRAAWYLACASHQLTEHPIAVTLFGEAIVLYRGAEGVPAALQDRCPHRGVALSLGQVEEGRIACAYHGWRFGRDGRCGHIPSLTESRDVPPGAAVRAYPAREQDGQVWLWTGEDQPSSGPLAIAGFDETVWLQGALDLACEAILPIENNLDICHAAFTHPGQHPQWFRVQQMGFREIDYRIDQDADGMTVGAGPFQSRFDLPDRVTVLSDAPVPFRLLLMHTPLGPGRCRQHWLMATGAATPERPHAVQWVEQEPEILAQDRRVLQSAQLSYAAEGDAFEVSVEADAPGLLARRLLRLMAAGRVIEPGAPRVVRARS